MRIGLSVSAFVLASGLAIAANQTFVVDGDGGGDFQGLQLAINAAADGDILVVRTSAFPYAAATVSGKGLTIVGEKSPSGARPVARAVTIQNTSAAQSVVVRGLELDTLPQTFATTYVVSHCNGAVIAEDCVMHQSVSLPVFALMVSVDASPAVVFTRCSITAMQNVGFPTPFIGAVSANASSISLYECAVTGSAGSPVMIPRFSIIPATPGGPAISMTASQVFASGSVIVGGEGGAGGLTFTCQPPAIGGAAIAGTGSVIRLDSVFTPGQNGLPAALGGCPPLGVFPPTFEAGINVTTINDLHRSFEVTSPAREGQVITSTLLATPGDFALLLVSFHGNGAFTPAVTGALAGAAPYSAFVLGSVSPSGGIAFGVTIPVGALPSGLEGIDIYEQVIVAGASGFGLLSSPSVVTIRQ